MIEAFAMNLMAEKELRLVTFLNELTSLRDRQLFIPELLDVEVSDLINFVCTN